MTVGPSRSHRAIAVWIVALLALSALPLLPGAAAHTGTNLVVLNDVAIKVETFPGSDEYEPIGSTKIVNGTKIRFVIQASWTSCPAATPSRENQWNATIHTAGKLSDTDFVVPRTVATSSTINVETLPLTVDSGKFANGLEGSAERLTASLTYHCDQQITNDPDAHDSNIFTTAPFAVDVRAPNLDIPTSLTFTDSASRATIGSPISAAVGSTISWTASATDGSGSAVQIQRDLRQLGEGTGFVNRPSGADSFVVPTASPPTVPNVDSQVAINFRAIDDAGNIKEVSRLFTLDNQPPSAAITDLAASNQRDPGSTGVRTSVGWTPSGDVTHVQLIDGAGVPRANLIPGGSFSNLTSTPLASNNNWRFRPVDDAGNVASNAHERPLNFPVISNPNRFAPPSPPALVDLVGAAGTGDLTFTVDGSTATVSNANNNEAVTVSLERVDVGFWNGGNPALPASYVATPMRFRDSDTTSNAYVVKNFTGKAWPDGLYKWNITVNSTNGNKLHQFAYFKVDGAPPEIPVKFAGAVTNATHGMDGNPVHLRLLLNESKFADTGFANFTIELVTFDESQVVRDVNNVEAKRAFTKTALFALGESSSPTAFKPMAFPTGGNSTLLNGWFNTTFPNLTVGDYKIRIHLKDEAGNAVTHVFPNTFEVRPRVTVLENANTPYYHPDGIQVVGLAAWETRTPPSGLTCDGGHLCTVANVTLFARNLGGTEVEIAKTFLPRSNQVYDPLTKLMFYNYTTNNPINITSISGLDPAQVLEVKAVGYVVINGDPKPTESRWVRVQSPAAPNLLINLPSRSDADREWYINTTGTVAFNATFKFNSESTPTVEYELKRVTAPTDAVTGTFTATTTATNPTPKFEFNYTQSFPSLITGEYVLTVTVKTAPGGTILDTRTRHFAVQTTVPVVTYKQDQVSAGLVGPSSQPGTFYVDKTFDIAVAIDHGYANITDDSQLSFVMRRAEILTGQNEFLTPGDGSGFAVSLKNHSTYTLAGTQTYANLTVTLPSGAADGSRFVLNVTAMTDAKDTDGTPYNKYAGAGFATIIHDLAPPAGTTDRVASNATGETAGNELLIRGFASDSGSGVGKVEVRIVDVTQGATLIWKNANQSYFLEGSTHDSWLTSDLTRVQSTGNGFVRYVELDPTNTQWQWIIRTEQTARRLANDQKETAPGYEYFPKIPLNRFNEYEVTVRVTDLVGRVSSPETLRIRFDPDAPVITSVLSGPTTVDWRSSTRSTSGNQVPHDTFFTAGISDNNCIKSVKLMALTPSGATVSGEFEKPAGYVCNDAGAGAGANTWRINIANNTILAEEVGDSKYWIRAEDIAGRVVETALANRLAVAIKDTKPADILFLRFEPNVAQVGGSSKLLLHVNENDGVDRVEIYIATYNAGRIGTFRGPALATEDLNHPNRTKLDHFYVLEVPDAFSGLSLESGNYLVEARVYDKNATGCGSPACPEQRRTAILQVVTDAAPSVTLVSPASTASYVNATPTFRFRVIDPSILVSGITMESGNKGGALTRVTPTTEPIPGTNGTTNGYLVDYTANLTGKDGVTVSLRATDTSGLTTTLAVSFDVDSVGPSVVANVTGNITGGDGKNYAVPETRVNLTATDALSGVADIKYVMNRVGGAPGVSKVYDGLPVIPGGADGDYKFVYTATDNASNAASGSIDFTIDATGPVITLSNDGSQGQDVTVTVADEGIGLNESTVVIRYLYGTDVLFSNLSFEKVSGNLYKVTLPRNASEEGLKYYVEALDALGNKGNFRTAASPKVIPKAGDEIPEETNHAPTISITAPASDAVATGTVELRWNASDEDGDAITITIALREPVGAGRVLVDRGENSGAYTLNVSDFAPGLYALVVTASDTSDNAQAEVSFRIAASTPANPVSVVRAPTADAKSGTAVTFTVGIDGGGRQVQNASFTVLRNGQQVGSGALVALAQGYSGTYTPTQSGKFTVLVTATYSDGATLEPSEAFTFDVQEAAAPTPVGIGFPMSLILLLTLGLLTVALAAYAAFVRWGK